MMKKITGISLLCVSLMLAALSVTSCRIYSFTGTSIQPDVKTITIGFFENKALKVNPTLSNDLTEEVKKQFKRMTSLEQVDVDGDLEIEGSITNYSVSTSAVGSNELAAQNRLTIGISITFTNRKYPEDDFEKSFSQYSDYDAEKTLESVESELCQEIIKLLVDEIFNATVANW